MNVCSHISVAVAPLAMSRNKGPKTIVQTHFPIHEPSIEEAKEKLQVVSFHKISRQDLWFPV